MEPANFYKFTGLDDELCIACSLEVLKHDSINECVHYNIFEGTSIYDGCIKTAQTIAKYIDTNHERIFTKEKLPLKLKFKCELFDGINNIFFDRLIVIVNKHRNNNECDGEYDTDSLNVLWDQTNKKFSCLEFSVFIGNNYYDNNDTCVDIIAHELRHIYQDYCERLRNKQLKDKVVKTQQRAKKLSNGDKEAEKFIEYFANKHEFEAYLAQLDAEIGNRKFDSVAEVINFISKNCNTWELYKIASNMIEYFPEKVGKEFNKSWKKFINHVGHIAYTHLNECCSTVSNNNIIKEIQNNINFEKNKDQLLNELIYYESKNY